MEESPETTCDLCMEESTKKHCKCSTEACNHPICINCCAEYCSEKSNFEVDCPFCKSSKLKFSDKDIKDIKNIIIQISTEISSNISIYMISVMIAVSKKIKYDIDIDSQRLEQLINRRERDALKQFNSELLLMSIKDLVKRNDGMFIFSEFSECLKFFKDVNEYISSKLW